MYKAFVDRGEPFQKLKEEVDRVLMSVQTNIGVKSLKALFAGSKTIPAIVVWAHTVDCRGIRRGTGADECANSDCWASMPNPNRSTRNSSMR